MSIPDYQSLMAPLLGYLDERNIETSTKELIKTLATRLNLSDEELKEMVPSRTDYIFSNRVRWAAHYMKKAGLIESARRGHYQITPLGKKLSQSKPKIINDKLLRQFPEYMAFRNLKDRQEPEMHEVIEETIDEPTATPSEILEQAYENLRVQLMEDLLANLKKSSPDFFERVVVELLVKMGYGGSRADAGKAIGKKGDDGIDGIIKEDKLGLDVVYIQAKRWDTNPVRKDDVMQFAGALQGKNGKKGIFITTSRYTGDAKKWVSAVASNIVLIDGEQLADLMIEYDVGVSIVSLYPVKKIDMDFFDENL